MLNSIGYAGPVSVEWEDAGMDRLAGAPSALSFLRAFDYDPPRVAFDAAFSSGSADTSLQIDPVDLKGLDRVGREP